MADKIPLKLVDLGGGQGQVREFEAADTLPKSLVGLGSVDNTSDADKPVSIAQLQELNTKASLSGAAFTGPVTVFTADTSENGNRAASTAFVKNAIAAEAAPISHVGAGGTAHATATVAVAGFMSAADKQKLNAIAAGAQVNAVASVAGKTGDVVLVKADVGLGSVDNTQDSQKPVSVPQAAAIATATAIHPFLLIGA